MHTYLMAVYHYFNGYENFEIEAENKKDALCKARIHVLSNSKYDGGNYDKNDIKCIKKLQKKKKDT